MDGFPKGGPVRTPGPIGKPTPSQNKPIPVRETPNPNGTNTTVPNGELRRAGAGGDTSAAG